MADINEINELIGNKQFQDALPLLEQALEENPNDIKILKLGVSI